MSNTRRSEMKLRLTRKVSESAEFAGSPLGELASLLADDASNNLSVPTLAKALGVATKTLYRWLYDGTTPGRGHNEIETNNRKIEKLVKALNEFKSTSLEQILESYRNSDNYDDTINTTGDNPQ